MEEVMITLKVEGMTCGHCEQAVKKALAAVPGVERVVEVNHETQRAVVDGRSDAEALIAAVREEGFTAEVVE